MINLAAANLRPETGRRDSHVKIIPLEAKDQWRPVDNIRSKLFFILREALDEKAMRHALDQLIRNHIPLLGARIQRADGSMAYHLPNTFSDDYALFQWSRITLESTIGSTHLLPAKETRPDGAAFFAPASVPEMEAEWIPSDWPLERKFEKDSTPLLLVHITSYTDATIVALSLPHAVSDQMGYASIVSAWLQLVDGQKPAPLLELSPGVLDGPGLEDLSLKELRQKNRFRLISKTECAVALMTFMPDLLMNPKEIRRILFLPVALVDSLRNRHGGSLQSTYGEREPKITNGDIVTAILFKLAHLGRKSAKISTLMSAINGRGRHPALPAGVPYLHNCITFAITRMPCNTPLSELARAHRLALQEGAKLENIEHDLAVTRELSLRKGIPYFGEPFELSYSVSNWSGAWRDIDFGPAVEKEGIAAMDAMHATAVPLIFGQSRERSTHAPTRYVAHIMCKADGGYWCDFTASSKTMNLIEKLLVSDPQLLTL